jgi:hypothetical protein
MTTYPLEYIVVTGAFAPGVGGRKLSRDHIL